MRKRILAIISLAVISFAATAQSANFDLAKSLDVQNSILKQLSANYVDSVQFGKLINTGINAMLSSLDPYTVYIPEEENEDLQMMIAKTYGGIGAIIYKPDKDGNVIINEPYKGSPADKYGLRCGDEILEIDGQTTHGLTSAGM